MSKARCALLGMDLQTRYAYEYFFRQFGENRYLLAEDPSQANILLIDIDTQEGRRLAQHDLNSTPINSIVVVISANRAHPENVLFLQKPVSPSALSATLEHAIERLLAQERASVTTVQQIAEPSRLGHDHSTRVAGVALAMDDRAFNHYLFQSDNTTEGSATTFQPDNYLFGAMMQARRLSRAQGKPVEIRWDLPAVKVDASSRCACTGMTDKVLRSIALTRIRFHLVTLDHGTTTRPTGSAADALDPLLWRLAIWTSRGRLIEGTSGDTPVRLRHWPNLTRLLATPHAMQIVPLWLSGQCSIDETARKLMISASDIHVFHTACTALELIDSQDEQRIQKPSASRPDLAGGQPDRRKLLSRILKRIFSSRSANEYS